jgi:hypothetical protein
MLRWFPDTIIFIYCSGMFLSYDWGIVRTMLKEVSHEKLYATIRK